MANHDKFSIYLSFLLRHHPEEAMLDMDPHGWVSVDQLITNINGKGKHEIDPATLQQVVAEDKKGRYRFSDDGTHIKACQGHSIPWVAPSLTYTQPPAHLYHGTTTVALEKIRASGAISKMNRHAVHMQADPGKAWQSATRWKQRPVILKIDAAAMASEGYSFGVTENEVWCTEAVPVKYLVEEIYQKP